MKKLLATIIGPDGTTDENMIRYYISKGGKSMTREITDAKVFAEAPDDAFASVGVSAGMPINDIEIAKKAASRLGAVTFWNDQPPRGIPVVAGPRVRTSADHHRVGENAIFVDARGAHRAKGYALDCAEGEELPSNATLIEA